VDPVNRLAVALLAVLVAAAPIAALGPGSLPDALASLADDAGPTDAEGIARSEDGRTVRLTDEALPGPTGYVLVTISATEDTSYSLEQAVRRNGSRAPGWGYATYIDAGDGNPHVMVEARGAQAAGASADGRSAGCCPSGVQSRSGGFGASAGAHIGSTGAHLDAGQSITLGLLAANWTEHDDYETNVSIEEGTLSIDKVRRDAGGVTAVDLVREARRNGTEVRVSGSSWASEPGEAHLERNLPAGGLVAVSSTVAGHRQARVSLELANGTTVDNGDGRNVSLRVDGAAGSGPLHVALTDLEAPDRLDRMTRTERRGEPHRVDRVRAMAVVADVPGLSPSLEVDRDDVGFPSVPRDEHAITVTDDALPAEDGWFAKKIVADERTTVRVESLTSFSGEEDGPEAALPFQFRDGPFQHPEARQAPPLLTASRDGDTVTCCRPDGAEAPWGSGAVGGASSSGFAIEPGQPVYVGLAAVGWGSNDTHEVVIRPEGEDPEADLRVAEASSGTDVAAVDLVEAASRNGTNAAAFGQQLAGSEGDAHWNGTVDRTGLLGLSYAFEGDDARGVLDVELPGGRTLGNGDGRNVEGLVSGLTGSGNLSVSLTDVERPSFADRADPRTDGDNWASAKLLLADVDLPAKGVEVHQHAEDD
jgi:hypothetical protein